MFANLTQANLLKEETAKGLKTQLGQLATANTFLRQRSGGDTTARTEVMKLAFELVPMVQTGFDDMVDLVINNLGIDSDTISDMRPRVEAAKTYIKRYFRTPEEREKVLVNVVESILKDDQKNLTHEEVLGHAPDDPEMAKVKSIEIGAKAFGALATDLGPSMQKLLQNLVGYAPPAFQQEVKTVRSGLPGMEENEFRKAFTDALKSGLFDKLDPERMGALQKVLRTDTRLTNALTKIEEGVRKTYELDLGDNVILTLKNIKTASMGDIYKATYGIKNSLLGKKSLFSNSESLNSKKKFKGISKFSWIFSKRLKAAIGKQPLSSKSCTTNLSKPPQWKSTLARKELRWRVSVSLRFIMAGSLFRRQGKPLPIVLPMVKGPLKGPLMKWSSPRLPNQTGLRKPSILRFQQR